MNDVNLIKPFIFQLNETALANIVLYGDSKKITSENSKMLMYMVLSICNGSHSIEVLNKKSFILHIIYW